MPLGASVAVEICIGCGICRHCKVGRVNLCEKLEELGVTVDGGMTEFVAVPARNVHVLPPGLAHEAAVFADPLACVIRGLEMITVTSGSWVAVLGPGQMGLFATQVIKRILRARVVVIGTRDDRLAIAREMGADEVVNMRDGDAVAAVREITDGGADFVYEAAGSAEALGQGDRHGAQGRISRDADRPQAGPGGPRAGRPGRVALGGGDLLLLPGVPASPGAPGPGSGRRRARSRATCSRSTRPRRRSSSCCHVRASRPSSSVAGGERGGRSGEAVGALRGLEGGCEWSQVS